MAIILAKVVRKAPEKKKETDRYGMEARWETACFLSKVSCDLAEQIADAMGFIEMAYERLNEADKLAQDLILGRNDDELFERVQVFKDTWDYDGWLDNWRKDPPDPSL